MANIKISDRFTAGKMLLFAIPCIGMQIVDNTYQMVDGYFVSNVLGEEVFAAENMIFPPISLLLALGLVFGAGGSALIASYLGEGKDDDARQTLSMISLFLLIAGVIISVVAFVSMPHLAVLSELIRTAFVPPKGKKYIVADFSAIECRVIAHLAGEIWVLDTFRNNGDIYCETASRMFGIPVSPHICRHTYCTNMARAGMNPKTLQYLMGHSDISITMNVYTHLGLNDAKEEMIKMEELNKARKELMKEGKIKPIEQKIFRVV